MWGKAADSLKVNLGVRSTTYFMTTQNGLFGPYSELKDYYASAQGIELLMDVKRKHWSFETDLFFTTKLITNAFEEDAITGKTSRYESGLFSVTNREQSQIFMPSIAELVYQKQDVRIGIGNFALDGFFLNMEHGRMIPSTFTGINYSLKHGENKFKFAAISHVGARSTSSFKPVAASLSQYNPGLDTSGSRHDKSEVQTPGIMFGQYEYNHAIGQWYSAFSIDYSGVVGVFHTVVFDEKLAHNQHLFELQFIRQQRWGNGGNDDPYLAYFQQDRSQFYGVKYSNKVGDVDYYAAASYIDGKGKLLFPREWGRESIVTFQGRERQEGMGKTLAVVFGAKGKWMQKKVRHTGGVSTGIYARPEPEDYLYNKYAMPSNQQTNIWWGQSWKDNSHALMMMLVYKVPLGSQTITAGQTINKVDMVNFNLIYRYTLPKI
jgi:hypothetical protein